jgi:hypothetical protein
MSRGVHVEKYPPNIVGQGIRDCMLRAAETSGRG